MTPIKSFQVSPKKYSSHPGFSIIELIMIILVIGILSAAATPRFGVFYAIKYRSAAKKIASDVRYAQNIAVSKHANVTINFYPANDTYQAVFTDSGVFLTDPYTHYPLVINYNTDPQYAGIDINTISSNIASGLRFDWQGIPKNSTGSNLTSAGIVVLGYRDFDYIYLNVTPQTGRVSAQ